MGTNDKFSDIIDKFEKCGNKKLYSINSKNNKNEVFIYEQKDTDNVFDEKIKYLKQFFIDYNIEIYDYVDTPKDCIQKLSCDNLDVNKILDKILNLPVANLDRLDIKKLNSSCDIDIIRCDLDSIDGWFISKHFSLKKLLKNKFVISNGETLEAEKYFIFDGYTDVLILDNFCYIFNENNFEYIFDFRQKTQEKIEKHKEKIHKWAFIDKAESFYEICLKDKNLSKRLIKALGNEKGIKWFLETQPEDIKEKFMKEEQLKDKIQFDCDNKIIVNKPSVSIVLKILTFKISVDFLTEELVGCD
ncbi:MAG: DUF4868 domain-containing protein [Firmicutes bacterium]|nr:DUF4868 domain-containing protein [Bacillota bacterium]MCL1953213.1 DUF4868 domain-containing protein [Bacillota bacterium]